MGMRHPDSQRRAKASCAVRSRWRVSRVAAVALLLPIVSVVALLESAPNSGASSNTDFVGVNENYNDGVAPDVNSVSGTESFTATSINWNIGLGSGNSSSAETGAQLAIDSSGSGINLANGQGNYNWQYNNSTVFYEGAPNSCPTATSTSETCPASGIVIPASGGFNMNTPPITTSGTWTEGYDSSRSLGQMQSNGDSMLAVTTTLDDPRYETYPNSNSIHIQTTQDNADESVIPTVDANGSAVPVCSQSNGSTCFQYTFGSYSYSTSGGVATCDSVAIQVTDAQDSAANGGAPTEYSFGVAENEQGTGGCPTGTPDVGINVNAYQTNSTTTNCTVHGNTCSSTFAVSGLGNLTASVDGGQGVTAFIENENTPCIVNYQSSSAPPPPPGSISADVGSSTSSSGTAKATVCPQGQPGCGKGSGETSVSASGEGALTLAQYGSDPISSPPFSPCNASPGSACSDDEYFDVDIAKGSSFSTVSITDCNLGGGNALYWWNGTVWAAVTPQSYTANPPCATADLSSSSSPTVRELFGTVFGVATRPVIKLPLKQVVVSSNGRRLSIRLSCGGVRCRGTISLTAQGLLLGRTAYSLRAGHALTKALVARSDAVGALSRATRKHALRARVKITVASGVRIALVVSVV